ncbi:MAG: hypothetical protein KAS32_20270, partial [Candidatus Peribacteraceae bacterium]|nr:hypothetical protein [Candidatus Peribacteraceae bacterium]
SQNYNVVERKTSRSILEEWKVSLSEVNEDNDLTVKFQEEITKRKLEDEISAIASPDIWFTERTHMDLFTYALVSIGKNNKYNEWLNSYYDKCAAYTNMYSHVFYLMNGCFEVEADGVRGENKFYSDMVDQTMLRLSYQVIPKRLTSIQKCELDSRIEIITTTTHNHTMSQN